MTDSTFQGEPRRADATGGLLYRLVWKWHFLASLYVLPFMLMLSLTGGIYLYKPRIEAWLYADAFTVTPAAETLSFEDQIAAVETAAGITRLRDVTSYDDPARSTKIEFDDASKTRSFAWVNPYTREVLKVAARDEMPMRVLRKFHGELLLGSFGTWRAPIGWSGLIVRASWASGPLARWLSAQAVGSPDIRHSPQLGGPIYSSRLYCIVSYPRA